MLSSSIVNAGVLDVDAKKPSASRETAAGLGEKVKLRDATGRITKGSCCESRVQFAFGGHDPAMA